MNHIKNKDLLIAHSIKWIFITFGYTSFVRADQFFILIPMFELLIVTLSYLMAISLKAFLNEVLTTDRYTIITMTAVTFFTNQLSYLCIMGSIPLSQTNETESNFFSFGCFICSLSLLIIGYSKKKTA